MELLMMKILITELLNKNQTDNDTHIESETVDGTDAEDRAVDGNDTENWISDGTDVKNQIFGDTVDIRYLEYPLFRIFTMSNFLFGVFSILVNFPYLELRYLVLSLCRTIVSVPSVIFGLFLIRFLEYSNEVFEWIIIFISGIRILITALTKLCSEVCFCIFSTSFKQQHVLS